MQTLINKKNEQKQNAMELFNQDLGKQIDTS